MKSRDQKAIDWVNESNAEREQKKLGSCLAFCSLLLVFGMVITGCGTYWGFDETEIPTTEETVSYEEISISETTMVEMKTIPSPQIFSHDIETVETTETEPVETEQNRIEFTVTAYCKCEECCGIWSDCPTYSGAEPVQGETVAADLSVLPIGSVVDIDGVGERTVQDTGYIYGNHLDLYFESHQDALEFGRQKLMVEIVTKGETK